MKPRLKILSLKMNSPPYLKRPAFEASSCQLYFPSVLQYSRCRQSAGGLSLFQLLKKNRPFQTLEGDEKIGGESLESDRALSVDPAASLKRICGCDWWGEGAARTRGCVMYSGGLEGGLIALSWADSGQMRRGGGRGSAITQHSSSLSVLFVLKGAESPISAKLEQEFKKKFIKRNCKTLTQSKKHCGRKFWQLQSHRNSSTSPSLVVSSLDSVLIHWNLSELTQVPNEKTDHLDPFVPMVCVLAPTKVLLLTTPIPMKMIPRWLGLRWPPRSPGLGPVETLGHGGTEDWHHRPRSAVKSAATAWQHKVESGR